MLHFVLCDDNKGTLDKTISTIKSIFTKHDLNAEISYATTSANKLLKYVEKNDVEVLLLDIDLSTNISGIDLAKEIRAVNKSVYIIFLTAHFEYSMLAYKVKTFDFLVKPLTYEKLEETILRLYEDAISDNEKFVKLGNGKQLLNANDILYIEKNKAKATIHTTYSDLQVYGTFDNISNCLPDYFIRCHKSYIVNSKKITQVDNHKNVFYINDEEIHFSKKFVTQERMLMFNERTIN